MAKNHQENIDRILNELEESGVQITQDIYEQVQESYFKNYAKAGNPLEPTKDQKNQAHSKMEMWNEERETEAARRKQPAEKAADKDQLWSMARKKALETVRADQAEKNWIERQLDQME